MQSNKLTLRNAIRLSLLGGAMMPLVGFSQSAPSTKPAESAMTDVVVTGSRIAVPNDTSSSPVIGVTNDELQTTGLTRVEDMLNTLPQVFAS